MTDAQNSKNLLILKEGFVVAYLTFFGYVAAYLFQLGYANYFRIEKDFIIISISTILVSIIIVSIALLLLVVLFEAVIPLSGSIRFRRLTVYAILSIFYIIMDMGENTLFFIAFWLFMLLIEIVDYYLFKKNQNSNKDNKNNKDKMDSMISSLFGNRAYFAFIVTIFICIFAFQIGSYHARSKKDFLVLPGEPEYLILKVYENVIIAASFERSSKTVLPNYKVINISDAELLMTLEKLGPLKMTRDDNIDAK
jgi:hypothetical protein